METKHIQLHDLANVLNLIDAASQILIASRPTTALQKPIALLGSKQRWVTTRWLR